MNRPTKYERRDPFPNIAFDDAESPSRAAEWILALAILGIIAWFFAKATGVDFVTVMRVLGVMS